LNPEARTRGVRRPGSDTSYTASARRHIPRNRRIPAGRPARPLGSGRIVLGSHGRAGLGGRIAGSVAADVASRSQRPVLIVHDHGGADDRAREPSAPAGAAEAVSRDRLR
jgi:hypothetical protein